MNKTLLLALVLLTSSTTTFASNKKDKKNNKQEVIAPLALTNQSDSASYAVGMQATEGLVEFLKQSYKVDTAYMADFIRGMHDAQAHLNTPQGNAYEAGCEIARMAQSRIIPSIQERELKGTNITLNEKAFTNGFIAALAKDTTIFANTKAAADYKQDILSGEGIKWLAENAKKPGVKVTPSGLQYKVLVQGTGETPKADEECVVKYEGKLINGTIFDSSYKRDPQTSEFRPNQVIKGWQEALCMMPVGSKWELYIPQELAYGSRAMGNDIPAYSTLIFTVELVGICHDEEKKVEPAKTKNENKTKSSPKSTLKVSKKK